MAVTGDTLTTFNLALKTYQRPKLHKAIPGAVAMLALIQGSADRHPVGGRSLTATWAVHQKRNLGWGPLSDGGDLAAARTNTFQNYSLSVAHMNMGFEFTGHLEAAGSQPDFAWVMNQAETWAKDTKDAVARLMGILLMLDGTANLGTISSISTNTITLATGQINHFELDMRLTVRDTASGGSEQLTSAQPASGTVTDVDHASNAFTIADATGAAAGDVIALYEFYGSTLPNGLRNIFSTTGTFQGVNRATAGNKFAQAFVKTATGALTDNLLIESAHLVDKFAWEDTHVGDVMLTDLDSERWYYLSKADQVRYQGETKIMGGYEATGVAIGAGGKRWLMADKNAWPGEIVMFSADRLFLLRPTQGTDSGWVENPQGGGYLFQKTGSAAGGVYADAKQGWWVERYNVGCDDPRTGVRLTSYSAIV